MTTQDTNNFQIRRRIDFQLESVTDPETGKMAVAFSLDPSRYKVAGTTANPLVHDTLDNFYIPLTEVQRMVAQAIRSRPWGSGQYLGNARGYIATRRDAIRQALHRPPAVPHEFVDRSEEFLASLPDGVYGFAVASIDLVGSTKLSNSVDPTTFASIIGTVLQELAAIVPYFHGHVLKFTGDGALIYFPPPSFLTANDNAIDCVLTMRGLILDAVNPAFADRGYPSLDVRVGIESGDAFVMTIGHSSSKRQRDLIGQTLNIACKIQASGQPGDIRLGQVAYQNLHTMWKYGCSPTVPPEGWPYKLVDGNAYPIYTFTAMAANLDS